MREKNVTHRTSVQSHENTKSCQNALFAHTHAFSLNRDETHRYKYCALFFAIIIIDRRFLLNARAKNVRVFYDAASSRSNEDDARHEVSRSSSVLLFHTCAKIRHVREKFSRKERRFLSSAKAPINFIHLRKLEKRAYTL